MRKKRVRNLLLLLFAALVLQGTAEARLLTVGDLQIPSELTNAADGVEELMDPEAGGDFGLASGAAALWNRAVREVRDDTLAGMRSVAALLAGILLLGVAEQAAGGKKAGRSVLLIGTAYITTVSAGQLDALIGLGRETITRMTELSTLLLPPLAAAAAASGNITAASLRQVTAVWFSNLLLTAIDRLFIPMVYLYIGIAAADAILDGGALGSIGDLLKKGIKWGLTTLLGLFTAYLTAAGAVSGAVDAAAVQTAKAAVSAAVPVVGNILARAAESVLAGAGMLKGLLGVFGMLAILSVCLAPFLHLGVQYLLYQGAAVLAETAGPPRLAKLMKRLGDAFMLVLAMSASSAMLLLISVIFSCRAVTA